VSNGTQGFDGLHGWKRALVRIVERSHLDCRKPVRCSFRFNRVTGNQDRHCSVCVGRGVLPFHPPGYMAQGPPSRASSIPVFVEPCLVLRTSRNDDDVARAADPLFAAEAELHLALEHPNDLLICVTVRLDMDPGPDTPPYDHPLVAGENAAADFFADLLTRFPQRNWQVLGQI
jgi:hypothetical protein